jgi:Ser-tRNA(Ala) deacylase AlaX
MPEQKHSSYEVKSHESSHPLPARSQAEEGEGKKDTNADPKASEHDSPHDVQSDTKQEEYQQESDNAGIPRPPSSEAQRQHSDDIHSLMDVGLNIQKQRHAATVLKYWHNTYQFRDSSIVLDIIDNTKKKEQEEEEEEAQKEEAATDEQTNTAADDDADADADNDTDTPIVTDSHSHSHSHNSGEADSPDLKGGNESKEQQQEGDKDSDSAGSKKRTKEEAERQLQQTQPYTIILKSTIFHPEGGGQPADTGVILPIYNEYTEDSDTLTPQYAADNLEDAFIVTNVQRSTDNSGLVLHHGYFKQCVIKHPNEDHKQHKIDADMVLRGSGIREQKPVLLVIDAEKRKLHSRLHTASHVLDLAVENIGYPRDKLQPGSGQHTPQESYVVYNGKLSDEDQKTFVSRVQEEMDKFVKDKHPVRNHIVPYEELAAYCGEGTIPEFIPHSESVRVIGLKGYRHCTCGGTHIDNTERLEKVTVGKLEKIEEDKWRLWYKVAGQEQKQE